MDGILLVNKTKGMTSHDVVDFVRKKFALKKVGHAGTLDPMATGLLVILIGKYTKSSNLLMAGDKEYEAGMTLGATSDTLDACGKISVSADPKNIKTEDIESVFKEFAGEIEQRPPMYSAVKIRGRKLYELARKGVSIERESRKVFINNIEILKIKLPEILFRVACSKGTYIRQLASDIGGRLGCGAYLSSLMRMRSGNFKISDAIAVDELKNINNTELEKRLIM